MKHYLLLFFICFVRTYDIDKINFCRELKCVGTNDTVCGIREENDGFRLKLFENECRLLHFGCKVKEDQAYGIISMKYCFKHFSNNPRKEILIKDLNIHEENNCSKSNKVCGDNDTKVCGIREDGPGYRVKEFTNKCELTQFNCKNNVEFIHTDDFICKATLKQTEESFEEENIQNQINAIKNLVIIKGIMGGNDANESIDNFFAGTHVFDLPVQEIDMNTRRRLIKNAGPVKIFVPLIVIPKEKKNDTFHRPTLSTCYHTCPTKCPDTYAPVCGVPGIIAREPALMFKNHCFMDVAQCKMFWENKSSTSHSSSYIESSFLFCMGDEMNSLYRFLPAIRTLQRMGRLKKKGKFRVKLKNFRFLSEFRSGRPKFMG